MEKGVRREPEAGRDCGGESAVTTVAFRVLTWCQAVPTNSAAVASCRL